MDSNGIIDAVDASLVLSYSAARGSGDFTDNLADFVIAHIIK